MAEPPKCPTPKCPGRGEPMPPGPARKHDLDRRITRYKCPTCGHEIMKRAS